MHLKFQDFQQRTSSNFYSHKLLNLTVKFHNQNFTKKLRRQMKTHDVYGQDSVMTGRTTCERRLSCRFWTATSRSWSKCQRPHVACCVVTTAGRVVSLPVTGTVQHAANRLTNKKQSTKKCKELNNRLTVVVSHYYSSELLNTCFMN